MRVRTCCMCMCVFMTAGASRMVGGCAGGDVRDALISVVAIDLMTSTRVAKHYSHVHGHVTCCRRRHVPFTFTDRDVYSYSQNNLIVLYCITSHRCVKHTKDCRHVQPKIDAPLVFEFTLILA